MGILVFNARRPGEIEKISIADFKNSAQRTPRIDRRESSDNTNYVRCLIIGKLCRNVPVIMHEKGINCINLILEKRVIAGFDSHNSFIFGLPSSKPYKFINAGSLLQKFGTEAKLEHPKHFFATNIRKKFGN